MQSNPKFKRPRKNRGNKDNSIILYKIPPLVEKNQLNRPYIRWCQANVPIYANSLVGIYSFNSVTSVTFLSFQTLLSASTSWTTLTNNSTGVFKYYTILEVALEYMPIETSNQQSTSSTLAPIFVNCNYDITTPASPINAAVVQSPASMRCPLTKLTSTIQRYSHKSSPQSTFNTALNVKYPFTVTPTTGQVELATGSGSVVLGVSETVGQLNVNFCMLFEGTRF
jgi:hypothetical protein